MLQSMGSQRVGRDWVTELNWMNYVFTLDSVFKLVLSKTQNQLDKPVCFTHANVQFSSVDQSCPTLCDHMNCSMPGLPVHHQLPELTQICVHSVCDAIQPSHPHQPLPLPPSIFPNIRVFSNESVLRIRWPKYWSFSFSISPSNEYSGLISFMINWLDLLEIQGTLKSLLQYHSSKASVFS